jgi:hypothetical protein
LERLTQNDVSIEPTTEGNNQNQAFLTPQTNFNQNPGFFNNNNNQGQQPQQQQQQQQFPNSRQVKPSQNNFQQANQLPPGFQQLIQPSQQFKPAALLDDETQAINLTNGSVSTARRQETVGKQAGAIQTLRPLSANFPLVSRRPSSFLSLTRPFRSG